MTGLGTSPEAARLRRSVRRRRILRDALTALGYGLIVAGFIAICVMAGIAHAQAPGQPQVQATQEVNTGAPTSTACACALGGAAGACLTTTALHAVRDASVIALPSCKAQLAARIEEIAALRGALTASQAQAIALGAANLDRQGAAKAEAAAAALLKPAEPSWFDRHAFGMGVAAGVVGATAITLGVVYALLPARQSATSITGLDRASFRPNPLRPFPARAFGLRLLRWK